MAGEPTLILAEARRGSFAVLREWTDQEPLQTDPVPGEPTPVLDLACLLRLAQWVQGVRSSKSTVENKIDS
mgnify:CR=1 FL=1